MQVGQESGRIIQPVAFAVSSDDRFVVADAPVGRERVQRFGAEGTRLGGFVLPGHIEARVQYGGLVLNGVASINYEGESILVNQPERGAVITGYTLEGVPQRNIGLLRATGYEADPDLHRALNTGLPLVNPQGGYYFVFQTGEPRFRKYDARGTLLFERAIQGSELDAWLASQPTTWPSRRGARELPVVPPIVRTATVDHAGISGSRSRCRSRTSTTPRVRRAASCSFTLPASSRPRACRSRATARCWSRPAATCSTRGRAKGARG